MTKDNKTGHEMRARISGRVGKGQSVAPVNLTASAYKHGFELEEAVHVMAHPVAALTDNWRHLWKEDR